MARYLAVVTTSEGGVYPMGAYTTRANAEVFCAKVNTEIERREDADFAAWQARGYGERDMAPDGFGRAYVMTLQKPRYRQALAFALAGNPDPKYARKVAAMREP